MEKLKKFMHGGLGRWPFSDARDGVYLFRRALQADARVLPDYKVWTRGIILDQGREGACVGFAWQAWENAKPRGNVEQQGDAAGYAWYKDAQRIDPWPGEDYEGTTVRAGARVAVNRGYADTYLWAGSVAEINAWLLGRGPVVVGSNWYNSMDDIDSSGYITIDPGSGIRGGHAYLCLGIGREGNYHFQNSWGENYGKEGKFFLTPQQFYNLVNVGDAEFCTAAQLVAA
jgi:hypothetical protein